MLACWKRLLLTLLTNRPINKFTRLPSNTDALLFAGSAVNLAVVSSISLKSSGKSKQRKHQQSSLVEVLLLVFIFLFCFFLFFHFLLFCHTARPRLKVSLVEVCMLKAEALAGFSTLWFVNVLSTLVFPKIFLVFKSINHEW